MPAVSAFDVESHGDAAITMTAIAIMLEVRAQLVAERGEPKADWPAKAREMFIDEVARRTRIEVSKLRHDLERPAQPLAPAQPRTAPVEARPAPAQAPAAATESELTFGTMPRLKRPAPAPAPEPETKDPVIVEFDAFLNREGWKRTQRRLESYNRVGRPVIVCAPKFNPYFVWEKLEEHGLAHLVDEVLACNPTVAALAARNGGAA